MNKKLDGIQKNIIKQFVKGLTKEVQKLQNCNTYEEVKENFDKIGDYLDKSNASANLERVTNDINNYLKLKEK